MQNRQPGVKYVNNCILLFTGTLLYEFMQVILT